MAKFKEAQIRPLAQQAISHWREFNPNKYAALKAANQLETAAMEAAQKTLDDQADLVSQGFPVENAWEAVRETYLFLPQETPDKMEKTPEFRQAQASQRMINAALRDL